MSFNVFNLSEAATNPFNFCVRLIKISILYLFPIASSRIFLSVFQDKDTVPKQDLCFDCMFPRQAAAKRIFVLFLQPTAPSFPHDCQRKCTGWQIHTSINMSDIISTLTAVIVPEVNLLMSIHSRNDFLSNFLTTRQQTPSKKE